MDENDLQQQYNALRRQGLSRDEAIDRLNASRGVSVAPERREQSSSIGRALTEGLKGTAASLAGAAGYGIRKLGGNIETARLLEQLPERVAETRPEFSGASQAAYLASRLGSEVIGSGLGAGAALKGATKVPALARALSGASRVQRGLAGAAATLPVDVAQAAAYREGAVLPGFGGALAENIALSGAAGALLPAMRAPAREAAEEVAKAATAIPTRRPGVRGEPTPIAEVPLSQAGDEFVSTLVEPRRRLGGARDVPAPPIAEEVVEPAVRAMPEARPAENLIGNVPISKGGPKRPGFFSTTDNDTEAVIKRSIRGVPSKVFDRNAPFLELFELTGGPEAKRRANGLIGQLDAATKSAVAKIETSYQPWLRANKDRLDEISRAAAIRADVSNRNYLASLAEAGEELPADLAELRDVVKIPGYSADQVDEAYQQIMSNPYLREKTDELMGFFRDILQQRRAAGIISEDEFKRIVDSADYYTPLYKGYLDEVLHSGLVLDVSRPRRASGRWTGFCLVKARSKTR
jgi:hypothetical protein